MKTDLFGNYGVSAFQRTAHLQKPPHPPPYGDRKSSGYAAQNRMPRAEHILRQAINRYAYTF